MHIFNILLLLAFSIETCVHVAFADNNKSLSIIESHPSNTNNHYALGDKGPGGGIVVKVSSDGSTGLELAISDQSGTFTWRNALKAAQIRGNEWRLPTKYEWNSILNNPHRLNLYNLNDTNYWSSTLSPDRSPFAVSKVRHAWIKVSEPEAKFSVRAVRAFSRKACHGPEYVDCKLGDKGPAGGVIFYKSPDNRRFLEVASRDVAENSNHLFSWGCDGINPIGLLEELFSGKSNTQRLLDLCGSQKAAVQLASSYIQNGYNDYHLPSRDELYSLYSYYGSSRGLGRERYYWTSSVNSEGNPVSFILNENGVPLERSSKQIAGIRPVREFSSSIQTVTPVIYDYLRRIAPNAEGVCYEVQSGSPIEYLPTPGSEYWGKPETVDKPGGELLGAIYSLVYGAKESISLSGMSALPSGGFMEALVNGLSDNYAQAISTGASLPKLKVLYGSPMTSFSPYMPVLRETQLQEWLDVLTSRIGERLQLTQKITLAPDQMPILVAAAASSMTESSWNHSKIAIADNSDLLWGGVNWWPNFYLVPGIEGSPTVDLNARLQGNVAITASDFLDYQWAHLLNKGPNTNNYYIDLATTSSGPKTKDLNGYLEWWKLPEPKYEAGLKSDKRYLSLAGLGYGVADRDLLKDSMPVSPLQTITGEENALGDPFPQVYYDDASAKTKLSDIPGDYVPDVPNQWQDFSILNLHRSALIKLASLAKKSIYLYQQDLWGTLFDKYDIRLMQVLAKAIDNGINVRIIVTSPGPDNWANTPDVTPIIKVLNRMVADRRKISLLEASDLLKKRLQYGTMSIGGGVPARAHSKLVMIDDQALYIGSGNAYPFTQAEYGVLIEDQNSVNDLKMRFVDPGWNNAIKLWDYRTGEYSLNLID